MMASILEQNSSITSLQNVNAALSRMSGYLSIVDGKLEGGLNFDVFRYAERQSSMFNSQLQRIEANVNQVAAATEEATAGTKEAVKEAEKLPTIVETAQKKYGELKAKIASIQSVCEKVKLDSTC